MMRTAVYNYAVEPPNFPHLPMQIFFICTIAFPFLCKTL